MARPRKGSDAPDAREKLIATLWKLLEDNDVHEISIGMITAAAQYNRGTFYYHFSDKDALLAAAVESELVSVQRNIFFLIAGFDTDEEEKDPVITGSHMRHLTLFMERGGRNIVEQQIEDYQVGMWTALLTPESGQLEPITCAILRYMSSGMLGLVSHIGIQHTSDKVELPVEFLKDTSSVAIGYICQAQGLTREDILARLRMLNKLSKINLT